MTTQKGFTLMEALVALAILAISAASLIGATETHIRRIDGLEARAGALWVAENTLAMLHVDHLNANSMPDRVQMLGRNYRLRTEIVPTDDPALSRVTVNVHAAGSENALVSLTGFVAARG